MALAHVPVVGDVFAFIAFAVSMFEER